MGSSPEKSATIYDNFVDGERLADGEHFRFESLVALASELRRLGAIPSIVYADNVEAEFDVAKNSGH